MESKRSSTPNGENHLKQPEIVEVIDIDDLPDDIGKRPRVDQYNNQPKFSVDDEVWLYIPGRTRGQEGPFIISAILGNNKYRLCHEDGTAWSKGEEVTEEFLELID